MHTFLLSSLIVLSVVIIVSILLQAQGTSMGAMWSGGGESFHTRRGLEKVMLYLTVGAVVAFTVVALALLVI